MRQASQFDRSAVADGPTPATERAKTIFVTISMAGSLLGLVVAIIANAFLK